MSHLDADYETLSAPSTPQVPQVNPDMDTGMDGGGAEDNQLLESTLDKTFQRFADRLAQNPEQVLRYEFSGQPLLYSTTDAVGTLLLPAAGHVGNVTIVSNGGSRLPRCTHCGADRVFELQLTPHAITVLEEEELGLEGMDWGAIILGVCSKDCTSSDTMEGEGGYLEEWVGVQWEELEEKRRR
jgi:pre-rRNA-processing protein TSR4